MERKFVSNPTHFIEVYNGDSGGVCINTSYMGISFLDELVEHTEKHEYLHVTAIWKITPKS